MKQRISAGTAAIVIVIVLAVAGAFLWHGYTAPTTTNANSAAVKEAMKHPVGGGPTGKALDYMREYQRTHPGAPSSMK